MMRTSIYPCPLLCHRKQADVAPFNPIGRHSCLHFPHEGTGDAGGPCLRFYRTSQGQLGEEPGSSAWGAQNYFCETLRCPDERHCLVNILETHDPKQHILVSGSNKIFPFFFKRRLRISANFNTQLAGEMVPRVNCLVCSMKT